MAIIDIKPDQVLREEEPYAVETSMAFPLRVGMIIFFLVFGVFGVWAALAPIEGAAHGPGIVTVKSYRKLVQHLEGGIVKSILVQNGDHVVEGQPLLELDDTQAAAQLEIATAQFIANKAAEARLMAERDGLDSVRYPDSLLADDVNARSEIEAQDAIFRTRKAAYEGGIEVLEQRIEQLESRLVGLRALKESKDILARSFAEELEDVRVLLSQGFSDRTRLRELERNYAQFSGEAAELTATISTTEMQIGETRLEILQQQNEFQNQVASQLGETQTNLRDITERVNALQDVVSRTVIRASVDGIVQGMQVHTIGGVIHGGTPIAEIIPQTEELVIEAQISPLDIDRVAEGQEATIRFSAFGSKVPTIFGRVATLSADAITDQRTGMTYYQARVEVTEEGMSNLGDLVMVPGMPAEVFIATGSRTFLQYLFKPFTNAMARSFIED
ncbi:MAG: hypothetical protein RLZZ385_701 [Pseudomonadota bacterium]|jgi:epimerase transport system membrane fusion protein